MVLREPPGWALGFADVFFILLRNHPFFIVLPIINHPLWVAPCMETLYISTWANPPGESWTLARGILRRFDGVLNAMELALLSGILWQGTPPEEDVERLGGTFVL